MSFKRSRLIFRYLWADQSQQTLFLSPTSLSVVDVALILVRLLIKSVFQLVGLNRSILSCTTSNGSIELPELELCMPLVVTDNDVERYFMAVGPGPAVNAKEQANALKGAGLALFLSAVTEATMLLLLAHSKSPIQPLGAVNVRNTFKLLEPSLVSIPKLAEPGVMWLVRAALKKQTRRAKRGVECEFVISLWRHVDSGGLVVFEQSFTMLQFVKHIKGSKVAISEVSSIPAEPKPAALTLPIHLDSTSPSKWARICKDYNPIHTSVVLAKVFGFPAKLAHGNLVLASAIEAAKQSQTKGSKTSWQSRLSEDQKCEIQVAFRRPVVVPATLEAQYFDVQGSDRAKLDLHVLRKDKVCVEASIERL
jgi:acyl dehydratase